MYKKILIFIFICISLGISNPLKALNQSLNTADSLFEKKKYTEAFDIYTNLLNVEKKFTPMMLLKMAYTKEALFQYTEALYYLNLNYQYYPNKETLYKMQELAQKHKLEGYDYSDFEYFMFLYDKYYKQILIFLLSLGAFYIVVWFLFDKYLGKVGLRRFMFVTYILLMLVIVNFGYALNFGIVNWSSSMVMNAPSAGSDLLAKLDRGNRVRILGKTDIWYRIQWGTGLGYIREDKVLLINNAAGGYLSGESFSFEKWL